MDTATSFKTSSGKWRNKFVILVLNFLGLSLPITYGLLFGYSVETVLCFSALILLSGLSITAGYHRLWAHKTYSAHSSVKILFAVFGTTILYESIIAWATKHRHYHQSNSHTASALHPRLMKKQIDHNPPSTKDLEHDSIARWQQKYFRALFLITNTFCMVLASFISGSAIESFLLVGLFRITFSHNIMRFAHRFSHIGGYQKFSKPSDAFDNKFLALLLLGEGYMNYHCTFPNDYRCGVRWHNLDLTKWFIYGLSLTGLAKMLRRATSSEIEKARIEIQYKNLTELLNDRRKDYFSHEIKDLNSAHKKLMNSIEDWNHLRHKWLSLKHKRNTNSFEHIQIKEQYNFVRNTLQTQRYQWRELTKHVQQRLQKSTHIHTKSD